MSDFEADMVDGNDEEAREYVAERKPGPSEIKACPFCGEERPSVIRDSDGFWAVKCPICHVMMGGRFEREYAIEAWNTRPVSPAVDRLVKAWRDLEYPYDTIGGGVDIRELKAAFKAVDEEAHHD